MQKIAINPFKGGKQRRKGENKLKVKVRCRSIRKNPSHLASDMLQYSK